jgi:hypothetical protein
MAALAPQALLVPIPPIPQNERWQAHTPLTQATTWIQSLMRKINDLSQP